MIRRCWGEQVTDEFAAALGEDRGTAGKTCALLAGNKPRKAPEGPERAAMPPQTGHADSILTAGGVGVWLAAKARFNIGNSDTKERSPCVHAMLMEVCCRRLDRVCAGGRPLISWQQ